MIKSRYLIALFLCVMLIGTGAAAATLQINPAVTAVPKRILVTSTTPPGGTATGSATVHIASDPDGARIILNGLDTGYVTPHEWGTLTAGRYTLRLERDGYQPAEDQFDLVEGRAFSLTLSLKPLDTASAAFTRYSVQVTTSAGRVEPVTPAARTTSFTVITPSSRQINISREVVAGSVETTPAPATVNVTRSTMAVLPVTPSTAANPARVAGSREAGSTVAGAADTGTPVTRSASPTLPDAAEEVRSAVSTHPGIVESVLVFIPFARAPDSRAVSNSTPPVQKSIIDSLLGIFSPPGPQPKVPPSGGGTGGGGSSDSNGGVAILVAPSTGKAPLTVTCTAFGGFGDGSGYVWNFGDGATGSGSPVEHTYTTPGLYTVYLTGLSDAASPVYATASVVVKQVQPLYIIEAETPVYDEVFIALEDLEFRAALLPADPQSGTQIPDGSEVQWESNHDGVLGKGLVITPHLVSKGYHIITISGYGVQTQVPVRVVGDLPELYVTELSSEELDRIRSDFTFVYADGNPVKPDEQWSSYPSTAFDQYSTDPTKLAMLYKLNLLRHEQFSKQPPFTTEKSLYDDVKMNTKTFELHLDCDLDRGGGGTMYLHRGANQWTNMLNYPVDYQDPDYCKNTIPPSVSGNPVGMSYFNLLPLIIHENSHSYPGDPAHVTCPSWCTGVSVTGGMDDYFEPGSGYAYAAQYGMWVNKYSRFDPVGVKAMYKTMATMLLRERFCHKPTSSNPEVQQTIDTYLSEAEATTPCMGQPALTPYATPGPVTYVMPRFE